MLEAIRVRLARGGTWPAFALLFFAFILCTQGFELRRNTLGCAERLLDTRFWYTPDKALDLLGRLGVGGRRLYAVTELSLDLVFPFIYGGLFSILIAKLYSRRRRGLLLSAVALAVTSDLCENVLVSYLAYSYDGQPSSVAWAAAAFTALKSLTIILLCGVVLAGAIWSLLSARALNGEC